MLGRLCFLFLFITTLAGAQISSFPYVEDFETGAGGWNSGGANNDWSKGVPQKTRITAAGSGAECWISGGLSNAAYNANEKSWVQSPDFDFTALTFPVLRFLLFWDTEQQYDGGNLQYSTDGGVTWINIGNTLETASCLNQNWFNYNGIYNLSGLASPAEGWSGTSLPTSGSCKGGGGVGHWVEARHCLSFLAGTAIVRFRFTFCSGSTCNNYDGLAFDSVSISDEALNNPLVTVSCINELQVQTQAAVDGCAAQFSWDFGEAGSATNTASGANVQHTYAKSGKYTITLTTDLGCGIAIGTTKDVTLPEIHSTVYPVTCQDGSDGAVKLFVDPALTPTIAWNIAPPVYGDSIGNLGEGPVSYSIHFNDPEVCDLSGSELIPLGPNARPLLQLPTEERICADDSVYIDPGMYSTYLWSDGVVTGPRYLKDSGEYWLTVSNSSGCLASDSLVVKSGCGNLIWLPRAFTPNRDTENDVWKAVVGIDVLKWELLLYNRYGQLVFSSIDPLAGWDGTFDSQNVPEGVYVYRLKYQLADFKKYDALGTVTLLR